MKYMATIDPDNYEDFKFFEDATGKFLIVKDANSNPDEWIALYFVEAGSEDFPQTKDIEPTVKGFVDTMNTWGDLVEREVSE